jgi:hypothetical protein
MKRRRGELRRFCDSPGATDTHGWFVWFVSSAPIGYGVLNAERAVPRGAKSRFGDVAVRPHAGRRRARTCWGMSISRRVDHTGSQ